MSASLANEKLPSSYLHKVENMKAYKFLNAQYAIQAI